MRLLIANQVLPDPALNQYSKSKTIKNIYSEVLPQEGRETAKHYGVILHTLEESAATLMSHTSLPFLRIALFQFSRQRKSVQMQTRSKLVKIFSQLQTINIR